MPFDIRHAAAAAVIVATLLIVGAVTSFLQSDAPPGRAAQFAFPPTPTPTPSCTIAPEFEDLVPLPRGCPTPEG